MNKLVAALVLFIAPGLVLADNSLNFAPPPSDYSMVFLGNLFGVVDGVLSGTGSQIMGSMFGVFNAAVLALGGIIIMYTLMVSTMNTAHEGQMLGQKWSSIWIPVRSTLGLALLIPKASGYCLMQIFVMWVVVQGVGAADKIWSAALSYLNRGGVIIQAQQYSPAQSLVKGTAGMTSIAKGAYTILAGQVCMLGLQKQLQAQRQSYLELAQKKSGPCITDTSDTMQKFCTTAVPDFLATVNAVTEQSKAIKEAASTPLSPLAITQAGKTGLNMFSDSTTPISVPMPNFPESSPYGSLTGICGTVTWNPNSLNKLTTLVAKSSFGLSEAELDTTRMSRAVAIQQMYVDLAGVAQLIIGNIPTAANKDDAASTVAFQQFGVPQTKNAGKCALYSDNCVLWGPSGKSSGVLMSGTEFLNAINDYNAVMMPTLTLQQQLKDSENNRNARAFITNASNQGWIMAGAYFYNLVKIQGSATMNASLSDANSGLGNSTFEAATMLESFADSIKKTCVPNAPSNLCTWFGGDRDKVQVIYSLIESGQTVDFAASNNRALVAGTAASTVNGFVNNSLMLRGPGQPGLSALTFADVFHFQPNPSPIKLTKQNFECGAVRILFFQFCLGSLLGNVFYNNMFLPVFNIFMTVIGNLLAQIAMSFVAVPLAGMADIFRQGVQVLSVPGTNPVVALANMGSQYINFSGNLWIALFEIGTIPLLNVVMLPMILLAMPLLASWLGVMVSVGFVTAYYVPILPYMIFTFGALAWFMAVIEAMVAAPIVALGVTHPEGHDAFGKGEAAIMILINVFLRPSMMIIGYIAAIALSYVGVWLLNAGYDIAISPIQVGEDTGGSWAIGALQNIKHGTGSGEFHYEDWAGIYAYFFSILVYTSMYLILVQKSFTLITALPDKVLRWIGGSPESYGQDASQWAQEPQQQIKDAGDKTSSGQAATDKALKGYAEKGAGWLKGKMNQGGGSGKMSMDGGDAKPSGKGLASKIPE